MKIFSYQDNYPELKEKMIHELEELIQIMEENGINYKKDFWRDPKKLVKSLKSSDSWARDIKTMNCFYVPHGNGNDDAYNKKLDNIKKIYEADSWSIFSHPELYIKDILENDAKLNGINYALLRKECKKNNYPLTYLNELINEYFTQGGKFDHDFY